MTRPMAIDTGFDVRADTPPGADPDAASPTLRQFHQLLWDKELPSGGRFSLVTSVPGSYLHHRSDLGEFWMTSDSVVHTYDYWTRFGMPEIVRRIPPEEMERFMTLSYTIGAIVLFPSWTGTRHWSINQARGMLTSIADRMDLTLECIRRAYAGETSPMSRTLAWNDDFFALFGDFRGSVEFFLLQDLLTADGGVRFFLPLDGFSRPVGTPQDVAEYRTYMDASMAFVHARNARIHRWDAARTESFIGGV